VAELLAASGKEGFNDYLTASIDRREQLYRASGEPPLDAQAISMFGQMLPYLATLRALSREIAEALSTTPAQGDAASAENLLIAGIQLGQRLNGEVGGHFLIHQLVGIVIEQKLLETLPPQKTYDWLGQTPAERLAELQQQKDQLNQIGKDWSSALGHLSEADLAIYFELVKSNGEFAAMQWLAGRANAP